MSGDGEFDDLLAAFNIPIADGQSTKPTIQTSSATDLASPKKLALNGNASTCEKADIESEDDEGWIIDEGGSSQVNKSEDQDGRKTNGENCSDKLLKGRRKQIFPKLSTTDELFISASLTPMQGWRDMGIPTQTYADEQKNNPTNPSLQSNTSKLSQPTLISTPFPVDPEINQTLVSNNNPVCSNSHIVSNTHLPSNTPIPTPSDKLMMPVIDPKSVVSKAVSQSMILKPVSTSNPPIYAKVKPKLDSEAIGSPLLASKLLNIKSFPCQTYKPSVPLATYQEYDTPTEGYSCKACGCCFLSDVSLQAHLKRPSLTIKYHCDQCCSQFLFYNKCSLWTHLMSHSENVLKNIGTLTRRTTTKPITMQEFLSCKLETTQVDKGQVPRLKCPACSRKMKDFVTHHLGKIDSANMSECLTCKRVLKNSCEKLLHQGVHDNGKLCPGCGAEHFNVKEYYEHGSSSDCLYWLSFPLLDCWICCLSFHRLDIFMKHLCNQHSLSYYKCTRCQLAFRNYSALDLHLIKHHPVIQQPPKPSQQRILKCPLCKNVFSSLESILTHLRSTHSSYIFERVKRVVYRCSLCPHLKHFVDRQGLQSHMQIAHMGGGHPVICDLCGKSVSSVGDLKAHRPVCWQESQQVLKKGINSGQKKLMTSIPTKTKRVLQCSKCPTSKRVFYSTLAGYTSHFRNAHSGTTPSPMEVDLITTGTNPSKASSKMPVEVPINSTVKPLDSNSTETSKRSIADVNPFGDQTVLKKTKVTPPRLLSCIKCGFNSANREKFLTHIKTHKENSSYEQCHECGLCFRSQMAVTRHMAMRHLIQTPVAPVVMPLSSPVVRSPVKPKSPKEEVSHTPKNKPEAATMECNVCYRLFTTDLLLRNHMRTHGMAFIRSKRSSILKVEAT